MTEPTMKEKRELIKNTYLAHTHSDEGGRFAKTTPTNVIGSSPVSYPKLQSGPWSDQPMPPEEPPLGFSVEETPVVGESWEVEKSLDERFELQRSLRDGAPERFITPHPDAPDKVTSPASSGPASSPTSLSKTSTVSMDGAANSNQGGRGSAPSTTPTIKRRLR